MSKQVSVNDTRSVDKGLDVVANLIQSNLGPMLGVKQDDVEGSMTLTRFERSGDTFAFALEFAGQKKIGFKTFTGSGTVSGTIQMTALGQGTTRLEMRGNGVIDGSAAKMPDFLINKVVKSQIDDLYKDMLAELEGPGNGLAA